MPSLLVVVVAVESDVAVVDSVAVAEPVVVVVVGTDEVWVLELDLESSYQRELLVVDVVVVESGPEVEHFVADVESAAAVDDDAVVPVVAGGVADVESAADYVADPAVATAVDDFAVAVAVVVVVEASS